MNRQIISPRAFALFGFLLILVLLYVANASAEPATAEQHAWLDAQGATWFHDATKLTCHDATVYSLDVIDETIKIKLSCAIGDFVLIEGKSGLIYIAAIE